MTTPARHITACIPEASSIIQLSYYCGTILQLLESKINSPEIIPSEHIVVGWPSTWTPKSVIDTRLGKPREAKKAQNYFRANAETRSYHRPDAATPQGGRPLLGRR
jgi:hypothetical protein